MFPITQELIDLSAPNATASANGKKISQKGGFIRLCKSADDTLLFGECSGSGKKNYATSADFINPDHPVFRCSCPSRQFPCKHALGLMYDYLAGKTFTIEEVPEDIQQKREKQEKRKEAAKSAGPKKVNKAAATKKMKKQLEGLTLAEQFLNEAIRSGLASLEGNSIQTYRSLAKQMGDYYLPGPQAMIHGILLKLEEKRKGPKQDTNYYNEIIESCIQLYGTIRKARSFLSEKTESGEVSMEDSTLYDRIGYIWQLSQLDELGLYQEQTELVQLSFQIIYDAAKAEYADIGYWVNLKDGVISKKVNLVPVKAIKHIKRDDTVFDCLKIPRLYFYPGEINKRIRWEEAGLRTVTTEDLQTIRGYAKDDLAAVVKEVKNQFKNALSEKTAVYLIAYRQLSQLKTPSKESYLLEDLKGGKIELSDLNGDLKVTQRLRYLPEEALLQNQVMVCEFFYDSANRKILAMPHAIVGDHQNKIIRLMY